MPARPTLSVRSVRLVLASALAAIWLTGCGNAPILSKFAMVDPYRADVVQGNFVSSEQAAAVKPGMSRQQVRDVLGTSLLTSVFHENRWDYVFTLRRGSAPMKEYRLTVFFQGDKVERVDGDQMPTEAEFIAQIDTGKKSGKVPELQASEETLNKMAPPASKTTEETTPEAPPRTSYPPLESPSR